MRDKIKVSLTKYYTIFSTIINYKNKDILDNITRYTHLRKKNKRFYVVLIKFLNKI